VLTDAYTCVSKGGAGAVAGADGGGGGGGVDRERILSNEISKGGYNVGVQEVGRTC